MNYDTSVKSLPPKGFIALMATIIISLILLVMVVQEGTSGWYARFNILGTEAKEQANSLAEGCANQALAALVTDPTYAGDSTSTTAGGTCHVFPIEFNTPAAGLVTISTQAQVRGSFANLATVQNMASVHLGDTPASPTRGTLIVYTHTINDNGGAKASGDFTENISAVAPSKFLFAGSEGGVSVTMNAGAYSVSQNPLSGYTQSLSAGCSGTIAAGDIKSCVITNDDVLTTLTVIANVINDNGGIHPIGDFVLYIDGVAKTSGQPYVVAAGVHTVSGTTFAGYTASPWGYNCTASGSITINSGDNKTCIITYDDNPPAAPACADTVMMLDRSGSMFTNPAWIPDEQTAAKTLIDLYSGVATSPKVGVGRFDDVATGANAELISQLSSNYAALKTDIDNGLPQNPISFTNLSAAISTADAELNSVRHSAGNAKVIILVSDGEPNRPSGTVNNNVTLYPSSSGTYDAWTANFGSKTTAVASNDGDTSYLTTSVTAQTFAFSNAGLPAGSSNIVVTLHAVAKTTGGAGSIALIAENGATQATDAGHVLTNGYVDYSWTMNTNPLTGAAWTLAEVNAWTTKFGVSNASTVGVPFVTQLYATVTSIQTGDTGFKSPTVAVAGGQWSNPSNAFTSNNVYTTDSTNGHLQAYNNFGFVVPATASITGIAVTIEGKVTGFPIGCAIDAELASNGATFTTSGNSSSLGNSDAVDTLGGSASLWGRTWTPADINGATFTLRVKDNHGGFCGTTDLDQVQARVYYTLPSASATPIPVATGNLSGWSANTGTTLTAVASNDSDTSYIKNTTTPSEMQSFLFPNASIPPTATNLSVTLHAVAKETLGSSGSIQLIAEKGATPAGDAGHSLTGSYVDYSWTMNTNPLGGAWTLAEVNAWTTKFGFKDTSTGGSVPRVSELYAVVNYSVVTDPTSAALAAADAAKLDGTQIFTIHFGDAAGEPLLAQLASGSTPNPPHQPGSYADPGGVTNGSLTAAPAAATAPNQFTNPTRAFASDNSYTTDTVNGHQQGFNNFAFNLPPGASVTGVEVDTEAKSTDTNGCQVGAEVSYNGGSTWTSTGNKFTITSGNDTTYALGGSATTWGHTWVAGDFAAGNFAVRLQDIDPGSACTNNSTLSVDQVQAKVYYTVIAENSDGDDFFIAPTSADMAGIFNFIGAQVCPAASAPAATAAPTTATLFITTSVTNDSGTGNKAPSDFTANVSASNPSQSSFAGSTGGTTVSIDPGTYSVTETGVSGYTERPSATCSSDSAGAIVAGETRACALTNDDIPPPPPPPNLTITTGSFEETPTPQ